MIWAMVKGPSGWPQAMVQHEEDGVPCIVQFVEFNYACFLFEATLFDGSEIVVCAEVCAPHLELTAMPEGDDYLSAAIHAAKCYIDLHPLAA